MNKIQPNHYKDKYDCMHFVRHMSFPLGNAFKYIWRAGTKAGETANDDIEKAIWYLQNSQAIDMNVSAYTISTLIDHLELCSHSAEKMEILKRILSLDLFGGGNADSIVAAIKLFQEKHCGSNI